MEMDPVNSFRGKSNLAMRILFLLLLLSLVIYIPNEGGLGIYLPYNLLFVAWLGLVFISLSFTYTLQRNNYGMATTQRCIFCGMGLIALPWLFYTQISPGVLVLLFACFIWYEMTKRFFSKSFKKSGLEAVFLLGIIQCLLCIVQTFIPNIAQGWFEYDWLHNHGRPFGIFQQVNLLGSFLASAFGCGGLLLFLENSQYRRFMLYAGLALVAFILALNQSRVGEIGAMFMLFSQLLILGRRWPRRAMSFIVVVAIGAFLGWWLTQHMTILVNEDLRSLARSYAGSNHERWAIIDITWRMIKEKPWAGWGFGSFEAQFSSYIAAHPHLKSEGIDVTIPHPHNELLFLWFQGGVVALCGVLLLLFGWLKSVWQAMNRSATSLCYALLVVPLLLHTSLEYPFYQSFIHLGLFIVLMRLGIQDSLVIFSERRSVRREKSSRAYNFVLGTIMLCFSITALYANVQLTHIERAKLVNYPKNMPWYFITQPERSQFDKHVALLIAYNETHDDVYLQQFYEWGSVWLTHKADHNVLMSMASIDNYYGRSANAEKWLDMDQAIHPGR